MERHPELTGAAALRHRHEWEPCDHYEAYRAARDDAEAALADWSAAPHGVRRREAYARYRAAADREDAAALGWLLACAAFDAEVRAA